jgi:hypothetical protein
MEKEGNKYGDFTTGLVSFLAGAVLTCGLSGCASNKDNYPNNPDAQSVENQIIYETGQEEYSDPNTNHNSCGCNNR